MHVHIGCVCRGKWAGVWINCCPSSHTSPKVFNTERFYISSNICLKIKLLHNTPELSLYYLISGRDFNVGKTPSLFAMYFDHSHMNNHNMDFVQNRNILILTLLACQREDYFLTDMVFWAKSEELRLQCTRKLFKQYYVLQWQLLNFRSRKEDVGPAIQNILLAAEVTSWLLVNFHVQQHCWLSIIVSNVLLLL